MRERVQSPQNGWVTEAMMPTSPLPSVVAPALRDLAAVLRVGRLYRKRSVHRGDDLGRGHDVVHPPAVGGADVHVLDEAERVARLAEVPRHRDDLILVHAALDDAVDLHGQACRARRLDPLEHAVDGEVDVVHRPEGRVVHRVEAHRDPVEPGVGERLRLARQERRVGRQRDLRVELGQHPDQHLDVAPDQRLAAGQAQLGDAELDRGARDPGDLVEVEQLLAVEEPVVVAEDLLRHAVGATEVAPVGD